MPFGQTISLLSIKTSDKYIHWHLHQQNCIWKFQWTGYRENFRILIMKGTFSHCEIYFKWATSNFWARFPTKLALSNFISKEIPSAMGEGHEHFLELDIIAKRTRMI